LDRGARESAFGALGALPGIVLLLYALGGLTLAVQAKQAGLPWVGVLGATPTQTLLIRGVLPVFVAVLYTPVFWATLAGLQRLEDWWKPPVSEHKIARIATHVGGVLGSVAVAVLGAVVGMCVAWLLLLVAPASIGLRLPVWVRAPLGIAAVIAGGWFGYSSSRSLGGNWHGLMLFAKVLVVVSGLAEIWILVFELPIFVSLLLVNALGSGLYLRRIFPDGRLSKRRMLSRRFLVVLAMTSLLYALMIGTSSTLELERVSYDKAPDESAGLISAKGEEVVVAICLRDAEGQLYGARLWRVPRADMKIVKVGGAGFLLESRSPASLADVMAGELGAARQAQRRCG
jgi:hypothetical protein